MRSFLKALLLSALAAGTGALLYLVFSPPDPPSQRSMSDELSDEQRERLLEELGRYT